MSDEHDANHLRGRAIRSFVVRAGRMTTAQQRAMQELWPRYGVPYTDIEVDLDALFGRSAPRVLEIGFGNGENLAALAQRHPDRDFLGIEVHPPGVGHLLQLTETAGLCNIRVSQHDAIEVLTRQIAPGSLDEMLVLFPDPWHKKRHNKRRIVNAAFADLAVSRLKVGGQLHLATDWTPYAHWMLEVLNPHPLLRNLAPDGAFIPRDPDRFPTRFEKRGERLGHEVHDLRYERRAEPGPIRTRDDPARP